MSHKLTLSKRISKLYSSVGIKGLVLVAARKCSYRMLPTIYKTRVLQGLHHPKIQTAYIELTNKCNLHCKMCNYQSAQGKTGFMTKEFFQDCINQLSDIGVDTVCLHFGGESLVHPEFKDFLKYAISKRDEGGIGSIGWTENGMLFNESIADLVVSLQVDFINFSLDGIGEINDNIRLGSKYSIIEKNIKYLLEKRGTGKNPVVLINMVDYGKTDAQKLEVAKEWVQHVNGIDLIPSILPDNSWENKEIHKKNLKTIPPPAFCHFPLDTLIISWDGKVSGCCLDYVFRLNLGDATKNKIEQIWNGSEFRSLRKAVLTNKFPADSPCYKCEFWQVNFEPRVEPILDGKARMEYGYIYRKIRANKTACS
jgi:MoaA/NifB/PqqE/SkfB family radical SAM enzyme